MQRIRLAMLRRPRYGARRALALIALALVVCATSAHAGDVYLGLYKRGVVHYDGKTATTLLEKPHFVSHIARGANGALWIGALTAVHRYADGKLDGGHFAIPLQMRVSASTVPWFGNEKEVSWFDGTRWWTLALPRKGAELLHDLEIDDQGRTWVLFGDKLLYTTGKNWTTFVGPANQDLRFCKLAVRGDLYVACWKAVHRLSKNTWSIAAPVDKANAEDVHVAADGTIYIAAFKKMLVVRPNAAPVTFALPRWNLRAFAVDDRGRIWLGSDAGLAVYDATGKRLELPRAIATKVEVMSILVEGNGPDF